MPKVLIRVSPTPLPPEQRLAYPLPFLARAMGVSTRLLYKQIKLGKLRAFKIGDRTVVLPEDAQRLLRAEPMGVVEIAQDQQGAAVSGPIGAVAQASEASQPMATPADDSAEPSSVSAGIVR
jgi:hypothetical protein